MIGVDCVGRTKRQLKNTCHFQRVPVGRDRKSIVHLQPQAGRYTRQIVSERCKFDGARACPKDLLLCRKFCMTRVARRRMQFCGT